MLSSELEHCLNGAFSRARKTGHGHLTIEHLLSVILDTPDVRKIVCGLCRDPAELKQQLEEHLLASTPPRLDETAGGELPSTFKVQPTLGLERVLQRAVFSVKSTGAKEVGVAVVLVAVFTEKQSRAVHLLNRQNITRVDVVNCRSHGLTPP